jgi:seryl-tRNA synthetase
MGIDLQLLQNDKGGDFEGVCASQKKRFAPEELAHEVLALYKEWTKSEHTQLRLRGA